jgi:predicted DCC family thiol-disulfide oxidoreductase YuxK
MMRSEVSIGTPLHEQPGPDSRGAVSNGDKEPAGHGIVLFDGTCAFCEGWVKFIARRDRAGYFRFGASQSPQAAALLARYGLTRDTARSLVLIEDGRPYLRSTASLRIAARLTFPWSLLRACLAVPRPLRDSVYRFVATIRHHLAGSSNACEIPPPEIRSRMI